MAGFLLYKLVHLMVQKNDKKLLHISYFDIIFTSKKRPFYCKFDVKLVSSPEINESDQSRAPH